MKTVLIVDDAVTVRLYHRELMEALGHRVIEAENGVEGLERMADAAVDLMLVDINMPKMDGYRFVQAVRSDARLGSVPIIMISTEAQYHDRARAFSAGANLYVIKPTEPEYLQQLVTLLLGTPDAVVSVGDHA
ncbi:response regulator [Vreelandella massiliensis]|uniref:response regulator n=1 Tax=Vreelandella massiliensis TaxID=1816686 RepID=UPI00096AA421|nr:response regulator [Halomonas massiliensis]MYL25105.1 response regulator [Halomonas alkaliantarctica]